MQKIGHLLGVSRQRVSALINSPLVGGSDEPSQVRGRSMGLSLTGAEFRMIIESLPHVAWLASPAGETEYVNQRGINYTGKPRDSNHDWNWLTVLHPDDRDAARTAWKHAIRTATLYELDGRVCRFDRQYRWHTFRSLPLRGVDGAVIEWIGTAIDVGDQKRLEAELRQAERTASDP